MAIYYFHVRRDGALEEDLEGVELASDAVAYDEAILAARELLAEKVRNGELVDGDTFEVMAADGKLIHRIPFKAALRLGS